MITPLEILGMHGIGEPGHAAAIEDCVLELYRRLEKLETEFAPAMPIDIGCNAGHPVPEYDAQQCMKLVNAIFSDRVEQIEEAQQNLIEATLDYIDHQDQYEYKPYDEITMREWGKKSYELHEAMAKAAKILSDL